MQYVPFERNDFEKGSSNRCAYRRIAIGEIIKVKNGAKKPIAMPAKVLMVATCPLVRPNLESNFCAA